MLIKYLPYFPHHWGEECGEKIHTDGENLPTLKPQSVIRDGVSTISNDRH